MRLVLAVLIWSAAASVFAQSSHAYKSVHPDGSVSYSDTRPESAASVEEMTIYQNSAAIEEQGKQRVQEMSSIGERLAKERAHEAQARREYQARLAEARQEVTDAERGLVTARESRKNATPERMALAEQRVHLARRRLREVQSAGR
ncbi:MAG: hypothetical protein BMS9Abin14_671 [Gammaproteobacteria bacterium]|nr:MAG: hypothetical protein BMS9Abin14_671 [Gammaproteobacteria bacterium]